MTELVFMILLYIVLGLFIETLCFTVRSIPIVVLIRMIETALVAQPVGLGLHVVQRAQRREHLGEVMVGALP
jgi:hypothetical protein